MLLLPQAAAQFSRLLSMADQAEGPQVGKVAFAASLHYRDDMVGIPEAPARYPL